MTCLFSPLTLRGITLRNRSVVSPMLTYRAEGGHINDWHVMNLGQFAAGGAGLVFMESTKINPHGCSTLKDAGLWSDDFVPNLTRIVDLIHELGAHAGIQLGHSGRKAGMVLPWEGRVPLDLDTIKTPTGEPWQLVGPSAIAHGPAFKVPKELSRGEIQDVIDDWVKATVRAEKAGFDVVEIHAAHGYLAHQFLSPHANKRTDRYGGSLNNRMRFLLELVSAVRSVWPESRPLFVRISAIDGMGWDLADSVALSRELAALGVDVVDCSSGGMAPAGVKEPVTPGYGYQVPYAARIRRDAGIKTMAVGLIVEPRQAEAILQSGDADLVAIGREYLRNPHWTLHAAEAISPRDVGSLTPESYNYWLEKRKQLSLPPFHGTGQLSPS